jgi:hypothetical protein
MTSSGVNSKGNGKSDCHSEKKLDRDEKLDPLKSSDARTLVLV